MIKKSETGDLIVVLSNEDVELIVENNKTVQSLHDEIKQLKKDRDSARTKAEKYYDRLHSLSVEKERLELKITNYEYKIKKEKNSNSSNEKLQLENLKLRSEIENLINRDWAHERDYEQFLPDGKEAEELRAGIETLLDDEIFDYESKIALSEKMQALLDKTDARDSLSYLEEKERIEKNAYKNGKQKVLNDFKEFSKLL